MAQHRDCSNKRAVRAGDNDIYLDIATGRSHCIGCQDDWPIENTRHHCACGAAYRGGEIWRGMAAEIGLVRGLAWLKTAGIRRGTPKITFLGWSFCLGCRTEYSAEDGFLLIGTRRGGMCTSCLLRAHNRTSARFTFSSTGGECSWCGARRRDRHRIVTVAKARICDRCVDRMFDRWVDSD